MSYEFDCKYKEEFLYELEENSKLSELWCKSQQENKQLKDRINKAIEHLELKQIRYLNEPSYKICSLDLQEIKYELKGDSNE